MDESRIRVAMLTDGHPLLRQGAVGAIERHRDLEVVAEGDQGGDAAGEVLDAAPDVTVIEVGLKPAGWSTLLRELSRQGASTRIMILYTTRTPEAMAKSLAPGVSGFVSSEVEGEEFCRAIVAVANGGTFVTPALQAEIVNAIDRQAHLDVTALSPRERQTLTLIAQGYSANGAGDVLALAEGTVKEYLRRIYNKLGVRTQPAAVAQGMLRGEIDVELAERPRV